jgi:hypothetical protein
MVEPALITSLRCGFCVIWTTTLFFVHPLWIIWHKIWINRYVSEATCNAQRWQLSCIFISTLVVRWVFRYICSWQPVYCAFFVHLLSLKCFFHSTKTVAFLKCWQVTICCAGFWTIRFTVRKIYEMIVLLFIRLPIKLGRCWWIILMPKPEKSCTHDSASMLIQKLCCTPFLLQLRLFQTFHF